MEINVETTAYLRALAIDRLNHHRRNRCTAEEQSRDIAEEIAWLQAFIKEAGA